MRVGRVLMIVTMAVGGLTGGTSAASTPALQQAVAASNVHIRAFYLQGMDLLEAVTLLRSQALVRQLATITDPNIVVVAETADTVAKCETLLRERNALLRVEVPHEPVELDAPIGKPLATRVFHVAGDNRHTVVSILRSIYQVRELSELAQENSLSVRAPQAILDSSQALLLKLELLRRAE